MKFKSAKSSRKKLRDEIGHLHYQILLKERGPMCEICKVRKAQGRFHILSVGAHPRLEFDSFNVLLSCWHPCHFNWHHSYSKAKDIEKRIKCLRGDDYETRLLTEELSQPRHDLTYLNVLLQTFKKIHERT